MLLRPLIRPLFRPLVRDLGAKVGGGGFSPLQLFQAGEQGAWYDPSDFSTQFQDSAGTTPVTAVGQPVGLVLDKHAAAGLSVTRASVDTFTNWQAQGSTPPTVNTSDTFLGSPCVSVTFGIAGTGGFAVSRAEATVNTTTTPAFPVVTGRYYQCSVQIAFSRALTAGEIIAFLSTGNSSNFGASPASFQNGTAANTWFNAVASGVANASGTNYPVICTNAAVSSPITVYMRHVATSEWAGNHLIQATTASRPTLQQPSAYVHRLDGVDDSLSQNITAGTLVAGMDAFVAIKRNTTSSQVLIGSGSGFFGAMNPSGAGSGTATGTPSAVLVDGGGVSNDQAALSSAVTTGAWHIVEYQGLDLSAWAVLGISSFGAGWYVSGDIAGVIICTSRSTSVRARIRSYLGAKVGIAL